MAATATSNLGRDAANISSHPLHSTSSSVPPVPTSSSWEPRVALALIALRDMFTFRARQMRRLFTHEDARFGHAHKILGVAVLLHFAYRTFLWLVRGDMGLDGANEAGNKTLLVLYFVHAALHVTSFQFHVPDRRNTRYNIIWPEMRLHTMLFAYRSLCVLLLHWLVRTWFVALVDDGAAADRDGTIREASHASRTCPAWDLVPKDAVIAVVANYSFSVPGVRERLTSFVSSAYEAWDARSIIALLCKGTVVARGAIVLLTMALADRVTIHYRERAVETAEQRKREEKAVSAAAPAPSSPSTDYSFYPQLRDTSRKTSMTMRNNPYPFYVAQSFAKALNLFYSTSQVLATLNVLTSPTMDKVFLTLLPIQTAPLLMTLQKKGVITQAGWHLYYTAALLSNYALAITTRTHAKLLASDVLVHPVDVVLYGGALPRNVYISLAVLFATLRFKFGYDKYVLWAVVIAAAAYCTAPENATAAV